MVFIAIFVLAGELFLRAIYFEGETFGSHFGVLVNRFERDFQFNQYDGPSRGPELGERPNPRSVRILIQGDSITWGQGVRKEQQLFSTLLLDAIRDTGQPAEMAVLARPGREIDGHLEQLDSWGSRIDPDVIIYQWYVNDIELDKSLRPDQAEQQERRRIPGHRLLIDHSYLYFFLYYQSGLLREQGARSYEEYLAATYSKDSTAWLEFERVFRQWAQAASKKTPRVLVAIYPHMEFPAGQGPTINPSVKSIQDRFIALCDREGLQVVNLYDALSAYPDSRDLVASTFDAHPGALAHKIIAAALEESLRKSWPGIFSAEAPAH